MSESKICRRCAQSKSLSEFYPHSKMKDGHLNICKSCTKARVSAHRAANVDKIRNYDRKRYQESARKEKAATRAKQFRVDFPQKYKAHMAVGNAVRDGRLEKKPCERCGREDSHGHHHDYGRPLDVVWLCPVCHAKEHKRIKDSH